MKSADAIVQALRNENVDVVFGIPGFPTIPVYDVLYNTKEVRHVLARHEQGASYMAYAYGMVTGKPGTCLSIDGPGATNLATALADAQRASVPLVAIVGKIPSSFFGKGAVHELDSSFFKPITKGIFSIAEPSTISATIHEAYEAATTGRKGPVCLEIPMDMLNKEVPQEKVETPTKDEDGVRAAARDIEAAAKLLLKAHKPLMLAGGGALSSGASQEVVELAEFLGIPVVVSHMGRGLIPDDHPLALGLVKNNPTLLSLIQDSDVVIAVGFGFSQISTFNWTLKLPQKLIHIDAEPQQIGKSYPIEVGVVGDAKRALKSLIDRLKQESSKRKTEDYPRFQEVGEWKKLTTIGSLSDSVPIKPLRLIKEIRQCLDRDAIIATDVGNFFFWTIFFMEIYHPGTLVCSSSFSVMGCGLPLAVGAKLAKPERQVVCLAGDGGFLMNNQELATAIENELAIPIIIMNDSGYGAVRHIQDRACKGRYIASTWTSPDFVQMAKSFGADGILIEKPQDIAPAMKAALTSDKPTVLDIRVDGNEKLPQDRLPRES